jgi:hypothetical protein
MPHHEGLISDLFVWGARWHDLIPLFSAFIVAGTTATVAIIATVRLNKAIKRTEFFLGFTKRFHDILAAIDALHLDMARNPRLAPGEFTRTAPTDGPAAGLSAAVRARQAHELYRQFFGLMFDEFYAFRHGFLATGAFVEWTKWRYFDANPSPLVSGDRFEIAGVNYIVGWMQWSNRQALHGHAFIEFMNTIHNLRPVEDLDGHIRTIALQYKYPWRSYARRLMAERQIIVLLLASFLLVMTLAMASI